MQGQDHAITRNHKRSFIHIVNRYWQLYLLLLLPVAYIVIFHYLPMSGLVLAFKEYSVRKGILKSPWVGTKYIEMFLQSPTVMQVLSNTIKLSVYQLIAGFPFPLILAIALDKCLSTGLKKTVQMVTYAPYFISTTIMVAIIQQFFAADIGMINNIISNLGGKPINFLASVSKFRSLYVWTNVWQFTGFNAIIYLAALSSIDKELHEAAIVDGASLMQRIRHIDIPGISPTIAILLILNIGRVMSLGFEKAFLMQNDMNLPVSEILATYIYKIGLVSSNFSFSTAVGLFNSLVNGILIISANFIIKRLGHTGLF